MANQYTALVSPSERFEYYVNRSGPVHPVLGTRCHLWTGTILRRFGYGQFRETSTRRWRVHRYAWVLRYGEPPVDKPLVLHHCDIRHCVNAEEHLWVGTHEDNMRDMHNKHRTSRRYGADNPNTRLANKSIDGIYDMYEDGLTQQAIADMFCVDQSYISRIVNRKRRML